MSKQCAKNNDERSRRKEYPIPIDEGLEKHVSNDGKHAKDDEMEAFLSSGASNLSHPPDPLVSSSKTSCCLAGVPIRRYHQNGMEQHGKEHYFGQRQQFRGEDNKEQPYDQQQSLISELHETEGSVTIEKTRIVDENNDNVNKSTTITIHSTSISWCSIFGAVAMSSLWMVVSIVSLVLLVFWNMIVVWNRLWFLFWSVAPILDFMVLFLILFAILSIYRKAKTQWEKSRRRLTTSTLVLNPNLVLVKTTAGKRTTTTRSCFGCCTAKYAKQQQQEAATKVQRILMSSIQEIQIISSCLYHKKNNSADGVAVTQTKPPPITGGRGRKYRNKLQQSRHHYTDANNDDDSTKHVLYKIQFLVDTTNDTFATSIHDDDSTDIDDDDDVERSNLKQVKIVSHLDTLEEALCIAREVQQFTAHCHGENDFLLKE